MGDVLRTRTIASIIVGAWRISLEWKLADLWIGVFFTRCRERVTGWEAWICLLPCLPIHIEPRPISGREFLEAVDRLRAEKPDAFMGLAEYVEELDLHPVCPGCHAVENSDHDQTEDVDG